MAPARLIARTVDAWGRTQFDSADAVELLYAGLDLTEVLLRPDAVTRQHDAQARRFNKPPCRDPRPPLISPQAEHAQRAQRWSMPPEVAALAMRPVLLELCQNEAQRQRVAQEMDVYEARGLEPLLRMVLVLVDHFRRNGIVWGVGRGSSVASLCLYLLGLTRVDPLRYDLEFSSFLR